MITIPRVASLKVIATGVGFGYLGLNINTGFECGRNHPDDR